MTYDAWIERFEPIPNPFDKNAGIDGCLFQPYGQEWDFVKNAPEGCVWTLTITDLTRTSVMHIGDGVHIVNREGYLVTKRPSKPSQGYSIRY